jgi:hypothetical protein
MIFFICACILILWAVAECLCVISADAERRAYEITTQKIAELKQHDNGDPL